MAFNSNFDSPLMIVGGEVAISGTSDLPEKGMELVFRGVAIQQEHGSAQGPVDTGIDWKGTIPKHDALVPGAALALGTETYRVTSQDDGHPAFATFTWAQNITLE